jgi:hypothetical protein
VARDGAKHGRGDVGHAVGVHAGDEEQEVIGTLSVIAQPLAGKKLTKKLLKSRY